MQAADLLQRTHDIPHIVEAGVIPNDPSLIPEWVRKNLPLYADLIIAHPPSEWNRLIAHYTEIGSPKTEGDKSMSVTRFVGRGQ